MNDGLKHAKSSMFTPLTMVSPLSSLQTRNLPERRSPSSRQSPFRVMNTAEYLRIHANAHPSKLRHIVKNKIFLTDNVEYLKRLVNDIGMDYVFRFLWYDGSAPSEASQWNNATVGSASKHNSSSSMPGNNASSARGSQPQSSAPRDSSVKLPTSTYTENGGGGSSSQRGRTWIQYCCYYNAHKCLQWIFGEIIRNYLHQQQQERHLSMDEKMGNDNVEGNLQHSNVKDEEEEQIVDEVEIIRQLLESPLPNYCGTNYVAVATLRNSYQCLSLLLHRGGLDPNMHVNAHGSTAAHLASWKNNVECLRVLALDYHLNVTDVPIGSKKKCNTDWNRENALGETPVHVAAREGCLESMSFFLDLVIASESSAFASMHKGEADSLDGSNRSGLSGMNNISNKLAIDHGNQSNAISRTTCIVDFSIRNHDGMDCAALAAMHNQAEIINLLSRTIKQLSNITQGAKEDCATVSDRQAQHPTPQSQLPPNNRTSSVSPSHHNVNSYILPQSSFHYNKQRLLPFYPTLNLRNSSEKHNHEMPIHVAARHGNRDVVEALFGSGVCDLTARDSFGMTALHVAVLMQQLDVCQFFADLSTDQFENFDVVDALGRTPLYIACLLGNPSMARILTPVSNWKILCHERKKSIDGPLYVNVAHQPPLHAAVANDHVNTVSVLLECGVDVDQTDADGRSAISAAAKLGYYDMCQMLILHGANANTRSVRGGPTPYQKAKKYKHQNVADLLYEFGGR